MDIEAIQRRKAEIAERFGEWTAHNIHLGDNTYTIGQRAVGDETRLIRVLQVVSDLSGRPIQDLRILDLACLEGWFGIEFALHGATVVAIDGRETNVEKTSFAKEALNLSTLEVIQDDVRNVHKDKYGSFDVVLCLGILYHLDTPDVFEFVEQIAEMCNRLCYIDTHMSFKSISSYIYKGKQYWGRRVPEHNRGASDEEKLKSTWSSLDNVNSFWFTRPSLYNLLMNVGFTSTYECHNPPQLGWHSDRVGLIAIKGQRETVLSSPLADALPADSWPERQNVGAHPAQKGQSKIVYELAKLLPRRMVRFGKLLPRPFSAAVKRLLP